MTHPERPTPGPKAPPDCPHCLKPKSATLYKPREWHHDQLVCSEECGIAWNQSSNRWLMELETCKQAIADLTMRKEECERELKAALARENAAAQSALASTPQPTPEPTP